MKRVIVFLLILLMTLLFVACGNENVNKNENGDTIFNSPVYTVDTIELDLNTYPDDYPLIAFSDFELAFENLKEANMNADVDTYQDIVDIFGADGAHDINCDKDYNGTMYKYYGWYADNGVSILITFKANGAQLEYYAYTTNGII
ncbi:MAG: hypothetical protein GX815_12055 [Clostridiales bacterium]|nr:hypothetical protein [Clostridiales bacterium]